MKFKSIKIDEFVDLSNQYLIFDVRSPSEYKHAHFPNAISLPLFNDEERKEIGTAYKKVSREKAIKIGLDYFGPRMKEMVEVVEKHLTDKDSNKVLLHCWRGGMRSSAVAWLLDFYGFDVLVLEGGYKRYRNWVLSEFEKPHKLRILSGFTGSGKTEILHELKRLDCAVIDLEGLANHKGSAFGGIGMPPQPSNEQFENYLAMELYALNKKFKNIPIWLESESSRIGNVHNNNLFFNQMKEAERIHIEVSKEERLLKIVNEYGGLDKNALIKAVERIQKRLGGLAVKNVSEFIKNGDFIHAFEILLSYYDKGYEKSNLFQKPVLEVHLNDTNPEKNAQLIIEEINKLNVRR